MEELPINTEEENINVASPTRFNFPSSEIYDISDPGPQPPPLLGNPTCKIQIQIFSFRKTNDNKTIVIPVYVNKQFGEGIYQVGITIYERFISIDLDQLPNRIPTHPYGHAPFIFKEHWRHLSYLDPETGEKIDTNPIETLANCPRSGVVNFEFPTEAICDKNIYVEAQAWCCRDDPRNFYTAETHRGVLCRSQ